MKNEISNYLCESAPMAETLSSGFCGSNNLGEGTCDWYHGSWQYLRLLDIVSNPCWHHQFFTEAIKQKAEGGSSILISGTADYTMLSVIFDALKFEQIQSCEITVLDTCRTPLLLCDWYASKQNIELMIRNDDIREISKDQQYDLIITDAFLPRFQDEAKRKIIDIWRELLTDEGVIATTIRIKSDALEKGGSRDESPQSFATRARENAIAFSNCPAPADRIAVMAKRWKMRIQSYPVLSMDEAEAMFSLGGGFEVSTTVNSVPRETGEVTRYCQILAELE
jgi:hypothetical protein